MNVKFVTGLRVVCVCAIINDRSVFPYSVMTSSMTMNVGILNNIESSLHTNTLII